jgi:hypothetical protein
MAWRIVKHHNLRFEGKTETAANPKRLKPEFNKKQVLRSAQDFGSRLKRLLSASIWSAAT